MSYGTELVVNAKVSVPRGGAEEGDGGGGMGGCYIMTPQPPEKRGQGQRLRSRRVETKGDS